MPWLRTGLGLAGLLLLLAVVVWRQPLLNRLWPESRLQQLHQQAAQALTDGRLSAADGSGARQLYEAAIAIDPDQIEPRAGLARVALAALTQARSAVDDGKYQQAHAALQLARELDAPRAQVDAVVDDLRQREAGTTGVGDLLVRAQQAATAGNFDGGPDAALPLYQRLLSLKPDDVGALEGREDALAEVLQQARNAIGRKDLVAASALIDSARRYDSGHVDLPSAQAELTRALDQERQLAERALQSGELDAAARHYGRLGEVAPDQVPDKQGASAVADAWAARAQKAAGNFEFEQAQEALQQAKALVPQSSPAIRQAEQRIAEAQRSHGKLLSARRPARADPVQLNRLLAEAAAAQARGQLVDPPGDSAFDKLGAARTLAPDDPQVKQASARLQPAAWQCFEAGLRANDLGGARECLDAVVAVGGSSAQTRGAAQRLASRWLAVGAERLGAGDVAGARSALVSARAIDPSVVGLEDFQRRLQTASINGQ